MDACVGIALFICLVIIVIFGVAEKYYTDGNIEQLKSKVNYIDMFYHSLDKRWGDMYDIIKGQQEEIKELRRMIEPKEEKKPCCGNCRFYHELNDQCPVCLNIHNNKQHKADSTVYADNKSITYGTIKCIDPNCCCEYYEPKEAPDD